MKGNVRIHQRVRYPAAGVKSDIETLLQKFVDTKSVRYEEFVRLWREGNYSLIHAGRSGLRENREFVEETFKIALVFALPPYSLQVRVAGVYTLYGLYHSQRSKPKQKVRVPLSCWKDLLDLHEEVKKHRHLDADYIIRKMIHDDVFEHVAYPAPLSVYSFYNEDDDDGFVEDTDNSAWQKDSNLLTNLLDEDSLGQLAAVHNKYHQLKCHLNSLRGGDPNKPSTSLDLIQNDLVDTIITHAQEPEIVVTSPTRNRKKTGSRKLSAGSSEVSASERAQRVSEIKQRALKSKVNTSSRSLRLQYLTRNWPHFKLEEVPTTFPQFSNDFSSNDMTNHDMAKLQEQAALVNNGVDNHVMAAILRHRLEMCLSQINQPQNANDSNLSFKEEQPPIIAIPPPNHNQQMKLENIDNAKEVMQQLVADKSNSQPYNSSLPWPNLMAMAVNRNANGMDSSNAAFLAGFENQNQESRSHGLQGLGTLLPPPPLIPVTTLPMLTPHVIAASFAASSSTSSHVTTSSPLDLTRALNEGNPKHTSSSGDSKIQPLDLRTCSRKRQLSEEMDVTPAHLSHAILQGAPDQQMAFPISSSAYLPSSQPATSTTSAFSAMSTQQIAALAPYLQNNAIMRAMYGQQLQNMNPIMQNGANQDYMRKWLLATAQQHHQAAAVQSPSQKRPRLDEMAQQQNKQRLSFHSYSAAGKDIQMANRRNESPGPNSPSNLHSSKNSGNGTTGKRYKRYAKPPYSYVSLITLAILSSPEKKLRLSQILKRIAEMFPFFNGTYQGWRDSVRHNLSQNECFVKVLKNPYRPTAKGNYWTVNITAIPHELLLRQNTLVSRFAQDSGFRFRKDLTEIFDLSTGQVKIDMPRRMLSGTGLIDDPATVMEALLLEQKKDDEPVCPIPALTGKVYSLLDIFVQDDDVALRMSNSNNRWGSKSARSRSNAHAQKPMIQVSAQQNDFTPHVYPQYDSQKLAMQNSNPATLNQLNNNQVQAQKEFWSKALSGQIPALPGLPFLQNYFAKAHQGNGILSNILLQTQEPNDQGRSVPACSSSDKLNPTSPKEDKVADVADDELQLSNWNQGGEKRNRRKSMQPTRRYSQDKENVKEENPLSPNSRVGSFVDSGIVGSMSPRSPTRSFSSDADAISGPPVIEQSPFVRSRSSDLSTETIASSPREVQEDVVPTSPVRFPPTFQRFNPCPPVEAGKMMYLNQGVEEEKDETTVRTPQRNKRGRPFKTILKAKVPRRSSRDSDESSEDDVITGIITPADPGTAKKRASRKAKKQAHNKMTKLVLGNHGSDDDDIDLREEDSDDEYDVAEECARELNTDRRTFRSALKRVKQAQISLADSEKGGAPSTSEESRKSLSKSVSAAPDSAKRRKLRSSDPSPLNISPDATKQSTDHVAEISSYQEHALPTIGRKTRARTACSTAGSPIEAVPKSRSLEERGTTISSSTKKKRKSKAKIEDDTPVKSSSIHTATILKTDEVAPPVDDTACILESPDEDVDTRPITPSAKRFNPKHQNIHLPSTDESLAIELKPNELVAFRPLPKYRERPLVGKVVSLTKTEVEVTWWMGTYTKKWYVWSTGKGNARKVEREKISREDVILAGFQFTASNKLPVQVAKTLRRMYARLQPKPISL